MKGKVQISRSSWHYKLHCFVFTFFNWERYGVTRAFKALVGKSTLWRHEPVSICGYFWSTVFLTLLFPFMTAILTALALVLAPFVGLYFAGSYVHDKYRAVRPRPLGAPPGRLERAAGFAVDYAVASKQKHCPLIELTD